MSGNSSKNQQKGNNQGGQGNNGQKGEQNRGRRRKSSRKKKIDPTIFWGDPEQMAEFGSTKATITSRPSAVVHSLGRPPLSGQQNAAEHYFAAVYDRAVNLAAALAAAGNLIEAEDLDPEER